MHGILKIPINLEMRFLLRLLKIIKKLVEKFIYQKVKVGQTYGQEKALMVEKQW